MVPALAYIAERAHPNFAGRLPLAVQAHLIRGAEGISGANLDYLVNTVRHLRELGIRERELERLVALAGPHLGQSWRGAGADGSSGAAAILRAVRRLPFAAPRLKPDQRKRFLYRMRMCG
jgi:cation transport protein ChaC